MRAGFPMYAREETIPALERLWLDIFTRLSAEGFHDLPVRLEAPDDLYAFWRAPDLLLAQTCGLPYRKHLRQDVQLIGAPDHRLDGLAKGTYCSVIIAREPIAFDALPEKRLAINEAGSQSGWAAPADWLVSLQLPLPAHPARSGSHRASAHMVAQGEADWAAIDIVSWQLIRQFDGFASDLVELAQTRATPALPFISAPSYPLLPVFEALRASVRVMPSEDQALLRLYDIVEVKPEIYFAEPLPPEPAI